MNSNAVIETANIAPHFRVPRWILLVAVIYNTLLVAVGMAGVNPYVTDIFERVAVAMIPAVVYIFGAFRYGRALFTEAEPGQRGQAWWRLVRLSAILFTAWVTLIQVFHFSEGSYQIYNGIPGPIWWISVTAMLVGLILLWAYVSCRAFIQAGKPFAGGIKVSLALLAGSAMVLASMALEVITDIPGWSVLSWQGPWPTTGFDDTSALAPPLNALCVAGYAAGLVLAALSAWGAFRIVLNRTLVPRRIERLRDLAVVVFWFAITNYLGNILLFIFINFFFPEQALFVLINLAWLAMLVVGIVLWFRFHARTDERGRSVRTLLLLWALPLVPFTVSQFLPAVEWFLFGLVSFVAGVFVLTACWWKMAEISTPRNCSGSPLGRLSKASKNPTR